LARPGPHIHKSDAKELRRKFMYYLLVLGLLLTSKRDYCLYQECVYVSQWVLCEAVSIKFCAFLLLQQ
jgi:hypothetical protein